MAARRHRWPPALRRSSRTLLLSSYLETAGRLKTECRRCFIRFSMTPLKFDNQPVSKYMHDVACYLDFIAFMVIREREVGEKNTLNRVKRHSV